jgi:GT2 family glycosyltransferase
MFLNYDPIEIIAVAYHRPNDFQLCISSMLSNTSLPYNLTIIDNSCGGLDWCLCNLDSRVKIIRNLTNIGKGKSFRLWYQSIMSTNNHKYFISLDADVIVPPLWLESLYRAIIKLEQPLAAIAPTFVNTQMHYDGVPLPNEPTTFYTTKTAGPLLLINRAFYESFGGYPGDCLYGHDDGFLCSKAKQSNKFIGYTTTVKCFHSELDVTEEYRQWKLDNLNDVSCCNGLWG